LSPTLGVLKNKILKKKKVFSTETNFNNVSSAKDEQATHRVFERMASFNVALILVQPLTLGRKYMFIIWESNHCLQVSATGPGTK